MNRSSLSLPQSVSGKRKYLVGVDVLSLRDGDLARGTNGDGVAGPAVHLEYPLSPRALALPLWAEVDSQVRARRLDVANVTSCRSEQFVQGVEEVVRQLVRQGALAPVLAPDLCCPRDILLEDRIQPARQCCVAD